jgi:hypothetical protein
MQENWARNELMMHGQTQIKFNITSTLRYVDMFLLPYLQSTFSRDNNHQIIKISLTIGLSCVKSAQSYHTSLQHKL